jgi:hypothetical protein
VTVTVDGAFVHGHSGARPDGEQNEIWPLVIEHAYAMLKGGDNAIARGGIAVDAMEALTGKHATRIAIDPVVEHAPSSGGDGMPATTRRGFDVEALKSALAAHKPIVFETPDWLRGGDPVVFPSEYSLVKSHAFAALGFVEDGEGRLFLKLKNPWNLPDKEPDLVPFEDAASWFTAVNVGELP